MGAAAKTSNPWGTNPPRTRAACAVTEEDPGGGRPVERVTADTGNGVQRRPRGKVHMIVPDVGIDHRTPHPPAPVATGRLDVVGPEQGTDVTQRHGCRVGGIADRTPRLTVPGPAAVRLDERHRIAPGQRGWSGSLARR